ncbi:MAG: YybH family protein, partial [Geminicoccales bacterium]
MNQQQAEEFAADWLAAWNAHDLERILSHYADPLEFTSPLVAERLGIADGTIRSKEELRGYFAAGIAQGPALHFEPIDVLPGVSSVTLYYRNHRGRTVAETMFFDAEGLVSKAAVHYR